MNLVWLYAIGSIVVISGISLIGITTLSLKVDKMRSALTTIISFAAGALLGDVFIHLLPELVEENGFTLQISFLILFGTIFFFIIEKFIHWKHCHKIHDGSHIHSFAILNLVGDGVHNTIDGLVIGASYLVSIPVGIATTVAVILHEVPQEISDFAVLIHGGYSRKKALLFNFLVSLSSIIGVVSALFLARYIENITAILVPFTAGAFIYIASSGLIPELHKETEVKKTIYQLIAFIAGVGVMSLLLFLE